MSVAAGLLVALVLSAPAVAQSPPTLTISVDATNVQLGQTVTLTIQARFQGRERVVVRRPPDGDFRITGGFRNLFSVNRDSILVQTYQLLPQRVGTLVTPPVQLQIGAQTYLTESVTITVLPGSGPGASPPPPPRAAPWPPPRVPAPQPIPLQPAQPGPAPPSPQPPPRFPERIDPAMPFALTSPSRQQVFVGQPMVVDYEVYAPMLQSWDLTGLSQPTFQHVWFEAVPRERASYVRRDYNVGGNPFRSTLAMRFIVVPLEPGHLEIPPFEAEMSGFLGQSQTLRSEAALVDVLPLPPGAPPGFASSNVGLYNFAVVIEPRGTRVGDPIRVTMRVEGTGLVNMVTLPAVQVRGSVVQPPIVSREQGLDGETVGGFKVVETVVIPTDEGELTLGPFVFHYFDPTVALYRTLEHPATTFTIAGRSPNADLVLGPPVADDEGLLDSLPPARATGGRTSPSAHLPEPLLWGLGLVPPLAWLAFGVGSRVRERRAAGRPERVKRSASSRARRELRAAASLGSVDGYGRIANIVRAYLRARFEIKAGALTTERTSGALLQRGVPESLAAEVAELIETCELARFDRQANVDGQLPSVALRAEALVKALEATA